jgi:succinate-semialdehyde dehydrogenase/glutarate-semialdehyde dehydrogenase
MNMSTVMTSDMLVVPHGLLIGGAWREPRSSREFGVQDPATGGVIATVADAGAEDASDLVDAAATAFPDWSSTPPRRRSELLRSAYDQLIARTDEFALLITLEMGKPLAESRAEVRYAADFLLWYAEEAVRATGMSRDAPNGSALHLTLQQPVGPTLLVTPWNFPLAMATRKIGPALAAGCTVVLKPAEETPLTSLLFAELLNDVGVPPGVVNVVTTSSPAEVVERILSDGRIRKLSFTGSTQVGRLLLIKSASGILRTSMELGGNAPFLVFPDADLDAAIDGAMLAKLRNGGQSCVAANRFLVHRSVAADFVSGLGERLRAQVVGPGIDPSTTLGPMINARQRDRAARLVRAAIEDGAHPVIMREPEEGSAFLHPVLLTGVPHQSSVVQEEIFGPVAPVVVFDDEEEALRLASDTRAGLVGFVYSSTVDTLMRAARALECGMVGLNRGMVSDAAAPFGGVKQSGLGREGSEAGLLEYLETKYLSLPTT